VKKVSDPIGSSQIFSKGISPTPLGVGYEDIINILIPHFSSYPLYRHKQS
jgi:hypothetical protein